MFINKYIQSWPWPYIYGIRNQEQVHHLQLLVTVLQQEVGIINRAEKVYILCFRDKNIFFWYLLDWNEFPRQQNGSHGLVDQRIFGWQVFTWGWNILQMGISIFRTCPDRKLTMLLFLSLWAWPWIHWWVC